MQGDPMTMLLYSISVAVLEERPKREIPVPMQGLVHKQLLCHVHFQGRKASDVTARRAGAILGGSSTRPKNSSTSAYRRSWNLPHN